MMCSHRGHPGLRRLRAGRAGRRPLAGRARPRAGAAGRVRQLATGCSDCPARRSHGWRPGGSWTRGAPSRPPSLELADYVRRAWTPRCWPGSRERGSWQVRQPVTLRRLAGRLGRPGPATDDDDLTCTCPRCSRRSGRRATWSCATWTRSRAASGSRRWPARGAVRRPGATIERGAALLRPAAGRWQQATELGAGRPGAAPSAPARRWPSAGERWPGSTCPTRRSAQVERLLQRRLRLMRSARRRTAVGSGAEPGGGRMTAPSDRRARSDRVDDRRGAARAHRRRARPGPRPHRAADRRRRRRRPDPPSTRR